MASSRSASEAPAGESESDSTDATSAIHITRCPHCATDFEVPDDIWASSDSRVVCGECAQLFDAVAEARVTSASQLASASVTDSAAFDTLDDDHTYDNELDYTLGDFDLHCDEDALPVDPLVDMTAVEDGEPVEDDYRLQADDDAVHPVVAGVEQDDAFVYAERTAQRLSDRNRFGRGWHEMLVWRIGAPVCAVLLTASLATITITREHPLVYNSSLLRPLALLGCSLVRCDVPARAALDQLVMMHRAMYTHPTRPRVLVVDASFANRADFSQAYPSLRLRLSNAEGQEVLTRRFEPPEYRSDWQAGDTLAAGQRADVQVLFDDPGQAAATFEITFIAR